MNDILKTYKEQFRENRHTLRRYTAFVLALAMITTLFVNWQLHGVGISMTAQYQCGEVEHAHTADCYDKVLICGYTEGQLENADEVAAAEAAAASAAQSSAEEEIMPLELEPQIEFVPHEHTDDCYTEVQTLTCMEEEHVHDDDCYDPEDGTLICEKFEHTHDESCYTTEYELTCGLEEGELVEQVVEPTQTAELVAMAVAEPVALEPVVDTVEPIYHHHTDACYEEVLVCPLPEHHHTVSCLSDTSADLETPEEWQAANADAVITGEWNEDLLSVAKTQLGYEQSEKNFEIDPADGVTLRYYSRYGQSYGNAYGEWDVMFLAYCLKYAEIPQSAIPQEASVLALRSSMSGMDWLLEEDGSAAQPGDIVIYNKYVTRTVAVDSSADSAEPDLDDLFSVDTAFENSVELEGSGVSAQDAAPSADDSTDAQDTAATSGTQDTVLTPEPVDPQPEQPAEKPVDSADTAAPSTVTSVSGADTLAPSVVSPAAEPQTTTVTDALPVETVGIVSSVDSDADTLTVISGDVDGKVAEVTLFNTEVVGVVDVAAAQYADTYGGQLPTISDSRPNRAPALAAGASADLSDDWITKIIATVDGTSHTVKDKDDSTAFPDLTVKNGGSVNLTYHFTIPHDSSLPTGTTTLTYQLPAGFKLDTAITNVEMQDNSFNKIGTITVDTDGKVTLTFDKTLDRKQTTGHFYVDCKVDKNTATSQEEITFPGTGTTIKFQKETDLTVGKTGVHSGRTEDGKYKMHYTVTASSDNGSGKPIVLSDYLNLGSSFKNASYEKNTVTVKKVTQTGEQPLTKDTDFIVQDDTSSGLGSDGVADGNPGIKITATDGVSGLPELGKNESYVLEYDVVVDHDGLNAENLSNRAYANGEKGNCDIYFQNELNKNGRYDPDTGEITWEIKIKPNGASIYNFVLKDTLPTGHTMTGYFKVSGGSSGTILEETNKFKDATEFTYKFDDAKFNTSNPDYEYTVTYKTKAPADFTIGNSVTNSASLELDGHKKWETSGEATYDDRDQIHEKKALDDTTLKKDDAVNNVFKMHWSLKVTPPIVWGEKDGVRDNRLEIKDYIDDPWVSSGKNESNDHYAILKDLQAEIIDSLVVTLQSGKEIQYKDLASNGLRLEVRYYTGRNVDTNTKLGHTLRTDNSSTETVPAEYADKKIKSFKLVFHKVSFDNRDPVESVEIRKYTTLGDASGLGAGQTIYFKNESKRSSDQYEYTIPGNSTKELIKMSSGTEPARNGAGDFKTGSTTVYSGNGADGETYIYYQLKLVTHNTAVSFPISVTDKLPDYVTYVPDSAYLVAARGTDSQIYEHHTSAQFQFPAGEGGYQPSVDLSSSDLFECTLDDTTNTLTFKLKDRLQYLHYPSASEINAFYIRYAVKVDKSNWIPSLTTQHKVFSNFAKWEGVGDSKTDTTVEYNTALLKKSADYNKSGNKVNYSIIINPDKLKLGDAEMIKLTDTMVINGASTDSAALVESTVKLYSYNAATGQKGTELPSDSYRVDYAETSSNPHTYTLTVEVPNGFAYVLEYQYANTSNTDYSMENKAQLSSYVTKTITTQVQHNSAGGSAHTDSLTIHKVDSQNSVKALPGAEFKLCWFDPSDGQYKEIQTETTDDHGNIELTFSEAPGLKPGTDSNGKIIRPYNYLYKLVETKAPDGYALDETPYYFIWTTDSASAATAYSNAVGDKASMIGVDTNKINYYYHNESITLRVKNTSNRLTIQKLWYDKDGNAIDETTKLPDHITVELYRRTDTNSVGEYVDTYTLNAGNGWKCSYDVPLAYLECYFYVKETSTGANYDVIYTNNNVKGTGTILVTNKEKENADYELPSTGGSGTLPYTAVGGTMMLSALAYSFIHRKRRREGRADD